MRVNMQLITQMNPECNNEYRKLFDVPHSTASAMLKSLNFGNGDKMYFNLKISPEMRESMIATKEKFTVFKSELTEIIHDLIKVRNRLFKCVDSIIISPICSDSKKFNIKEFGNFLKNSKLIENDPYYSIFGCWDIKRKTDNSNYDEVNLSDIESKEMFNPSQVLD